MYSLKLSASVLLLMTCAAMVNGPRLRAQENKNAPQNKAKSTAVKCTVLVRGAHCKRDVSAIRMALAKLKGVKFKAVDISEGPKPRYFSDPFEVVLLDPARVDIGLLAEAVSKAQTPHGKEYPPKVNLVLFTEQTIDEPSVMALRAALRDVNGLEVDTPGGLGGIPNKGLYWIQLENAGGAGLAEILKAARTAKIAFTTVK